MAGHAGHAGTGGQAGTGGGGRLGLGGRPRKASSSLSTFQEWSDWRIPMGGRSDEGNPTCCGCGCCCCCCRCCGCCCCCCCCCSLAGRTGSAVATTMIDCCCCCCPCCCCRCRCCCCCCCCCSGAGLDLLVDRGVVAGGEDAQIVQGEDRGRVDGAAEADGGGVAGDGGLVDVVAAAGASEEALVADDGVDVGRGTLLLLLLSLLLLLLSLLLLFLLLLLLFLLLLLSLMVAGREEKSPIPSAHMVLRYLYSKTALHAFQLYGFQATWTSSAVVVPTLLYSVPKARRYQLPASLS